ncbi:hypothetical protein FJY71_06900, partial [candidate division WOR-3 bacterium]|nr:hypothetical protein [candidate division WOR-3 bacterium]
MNALLVPLVLLSLGAGPVQFSGSVGLTGTAEFITGDTLQAPYSNLNFTLNPSLSIFGIPLSSDLLLSSMESSLRQALNKFRIGIDPVSMLRSRLDAPKFLQYLPRLDVGTFSPSYSALTLSGASVSGVGIEYQPWKFYLAGAAGRSQRAVEGTDSTDAAYARQLYAGKFGFGKKEATHYYVTFVHAKDDPNSVSRNWRLYQPDTANPADTVEVVTPRENFVFGMELNLHLFKGAFRLESEIAGIELTRDNRLEIYDHKSVPNWVERFLQTRLSSQFDFAYKVRPVLNVFDTRLYGEVKMVGPGYVSLGAYSLRNDNLAYSAGLERDFFDRSV